MDKFIVGGGLKINTSGEVINTVEFYLNRDTLSLFFTLSQTKHISSHSREYLLTID